MTSGCGIRQRYAAAISDAVAAAHGKHMVWGSDDCMLFVANIDLVVIGKDPAAPLRRRYRSQRGARRVMGRCGVLGAARRAARRMGWKRIEPRRPRCGDRGLIMTDSGPAATIFDGQFWIGRIDGGISGVRPVVGQKVTAMYAWGIR